MEYRGSARRHRPAAGQRHGGTGRPDLFAEVRHVPRRERGESAAGLRADGRCSEIRSHRHAQDRHLLQVCHDAVRRHATVDAVSDAATLTNDEVYALSAYILSLNKIIGENDVMNAETLPKVKMPNRDNFIVRYPDKIRPWRSGAATRSPDGAQRDPGFASCWTIPDSLRSVRATCAFDKDQ